MRLQRDPFLTLDPFNLFINSPGEGEKKNNKRKKKAQMASKIKEEGQRKGH